MGLCPCDELAGCLPSASHTFHSSRCSSQLNPCSTWKQRLSKGARSCSQSFGGAYESWVPLLRYSEDTNGVDLIPWCKVSLQKWIVKLLLARLPPSNGATLQETFFPTGMKSFSKVQLPWLDKSVCILCHSRSCFFSCVWRWIHAENHEHHQVSPSIKSHIDMDPRNRFHTGTFSQIYWIMMLTYSPFIKGNPVFIVTFSFHSSFVPNPATWFLLLSLLLFTVIKTPLSVEKYFIWLWS